MYNVLSIEDSEGDIILIREAFDEISSEVNLTFIKDGQLAIDYLNELTLKNDQNELPDLILLDINLPKISGHHILQTAKNNNLTKDIPIVILSTSSSTVDIKKAYENLANSFVTKPDRLDDFFGIIKGINHFWLKT